MMTKIFRQIRTKIIRPIRTKIFRQITQLSKGLITSLTDRMDSRVLPKWAELKKVAISLESSSFSVLKVSYSGVVCSTAASTLSLYC